MSSAIAASRVSNLVSQVLLLSATYSSRLALNLDYMPMGGDSFNLLFVRMLQLKGFTRRDDVEITRRVRVWVPGHVSPLTVEINFLQREGPNERYDVQKITRIESLEDQSYLAGLTYNYLLSGELDEKVPLVKGQI
jgi:hypothetical protein